MKQARREELRTILEEAYDRYARPDFVQDDPIQVPRHFTRREDAESIGFITATIAWGQRKTIIANAWKLARAMDERPHQFIMHADKDDLRLLEKFVHRTFNGADLRQFILSIRHLYTTYGGMEAAFLDGEGPVDMGTAIPLFRRRFFEVAHDPRTLKHVADPARGSHAKRINMYLRWMVRSADRGIDLGLWKRIRPAQLMMPLDVHTGRIARMLGLLARKQDDWRAVEELTEALRGFDPMDPVRFDIALFGMGVAAARKSDRLP